MHGTVPMERRCVAPAYMANVALTFCEENVGNPGRKESSNEDGEDSASTTPSADGRATSVTIKIVPRVSQHCASWKMQTDARRKCADTIKSTEKSKTLVECISCVAPCQSNGQGEDPPCMAEVCVKKTAPLVVRWNRRMRAGEFLRQLHSFGISETPLL